jgi:hypothetical protein
MGAFVSMVGCAGLEEDDSEMQLFDVTVGAADAAQQAVVPESSSATFHFSGMIHELVVVECTDDCAMYDEYCSFGAATVIWQTGVGEYEWNPDGDLEPRLEPPTIATGIQYGVMPDGAGFATEAQPLLDGRYAIWMDEYDLCDTGYGQAECLHSKRYGCAYFDVIDGEVIER